MRSINAHGTCEKIGNKQQQLSQKEGKKDTRIKTGMEEETRMKYKESNDIGLQAKKTQK